MLDSVTKKRIDDLRNILVGKIPSPQSQVEQITTGLIYKFMYDMDEEAVEMGGVPSFFVDDYEKYSWKHLFDPKLGGADKVQLYSDAIENMYTNPTAPQLFREIFKNSFLPFKDPSTLNMFLKEINEFHYSHSEKLGDAFEYLLSFMGSQGDAGQFRTPRHIIDFIVDIVNPQKNETILDPACGTAGFLISSYKHILSQNTDSKLGDKLNASERKQVGDNLVGYDISPDMTRISLVNMYLHQFASPQIHEYDTLSSEDRWNEYYDVILANPPFMTPKGGIQPHSRFGVQSTRAEVLFVDYIIEHLKPTGRAGIVVPEGIIFQTGTAYKTLRKKLVEDCLFGVISLPAGVFQPYAGVKTSILILDKELNQRSESIFFAKVENDGFSLGAQRTPIQQNDLPEILESLLTNEENSYINFFKKADIAESDYSLSVSKYLTNIQFDSIFPKVPLGEICDVRDGTHDSPKYVHEGYPLVTSKNVINGKIDFSNTKLISKEDLNKINKRSKVDLGDILMPMIGTIGRPTIVDFEKDFAIKNVALVKSDNQRVLSRFVRAVLDSQVFAQYISQNERGSTQKFISLGSLRTFPIPLPPIDVQQQIVDELEGYQKIIDGCRQVVENYKPTIDIDPSWEMVELGDLVSVNNGNTLTEFDEQGELAGIKVSDMNLADNQVEIVTSNNRVNISRFNEKHILPIGSVIFPKRGAAIATNKKRITKIPCVIDNNCMALTVTDDRLLSEYLFNFLCGFDLTTISKSAGLALINNPDIKGVKIPLPSIDVQKSIIEEIESERNAIDSNKQLSKKFLQKIQDRISKVWGEGFEPLQPSNDEIMEQIESGVLVHPQNNIWHDFFKFLKSKIPNEVDVPNPLILGGSGANDFSKNERLKEHLKVAEQNGLLSDALEYLSKIPDSQWVKSDGNLDPNELDYWQLEELHNKDFEENSE